MNFIFIFDFQPYLTVLEKYILKRYKFVLKVMTLPPLRMSEFRRNNSMARIYLDGRGDLEKYTYPELCVKQKHAQKTPSYKKCDKKCVCKVYLLESVFEGLTYKGHNVVSVISLLYTVYRNIFNTRKFTG